MEKFEDIQNSFKNIRSNFTQNVKDKVGASIDQEQLEPYENTILKMRTIEDRATMEVINIDRLLVEARAILPRI
jgi:hypothetical protein